MGSQVFALYDGACFACGATQGLEIDHTMPRARGGDAAFCNLQSLCGPCGNRKGQSAPEEVGVTDPMYFRRPPSDAYEGLFW